MQICAKTSANSRDSNQLVNLCIQDKLHFVPVGSSRSEHDECEQQKL